jgi:hypothetical protein
VKRDCLLVFECGPILAMKVDSAARGSSDLSFSFFFGEGLVSSTWPAR